MTNTPAPRNSDTRAEHTRRRARNLAARLNQLNPRDPTHAATLTAITTALTQLHTT